MRLFSNRSQMTSKCGKNKKGAHEAIAECVTDVLTTKMTSSVIYYWTDARQHGIYLFYIRKKQTTTEKVFCFKILQRDSKAGLCSALRPLWQARKKTIWRNLLFIQMKQSHWLLCVAKEFWLVQENHATDKLDSSVAPRGMKTYSESKIELRNLKKMLEK